MIFYGFTIILIKLIYFLNDCSILASDGEVAVSFTKSFQKQKIQAAGIRYCYCVAINNDLSNIKNEYVYNCYKVDESNLRCFQKNDVPGKV